jgi:Schlafen, AlbA_2
MNNRLKYALAQEITNRAVLTQIANRRKSNLFAADYLRDVKQRFPDALNKQSIPADEELWELENFENFLQKRREMLAEELNKFLGDITETIEFESELTVDELIKEGESSDLEFKSSLMWSYTEEKIDKILQTVILKTIAAFSNGEGGTLLIGVDDEANILGLNRDYVALNGNRDEFELHLRNLINATFGKVFATSNLIITFPKFNGFEICKIEIKRSEKPLFLEIADKNGQKIEKFYLRSGNSSQELKMSELGEYLKTRFK